MMRERARRSFATGLGTGVSCTLCFDLWPERAHDSTARHNPRLRDYSEALPRSDGRWSPPRLLYLLRSPCKQT